MTIELGGGLRDDEGYAERTLAGLRNMPRIAGVLPGTVNPPPRQTLMTELAIVQPAAGGLYVPELQLDSMGREVAGNTLTSRKLV